MSSADRSRATEIRGPISKHKASSRGPLALQEDWGRSEKYHARPRHLYALLFLDGCAYIGQTVDLRKREQQHRLPAGGWCGFTFECVHLGTIDGTKDQASVLEHAWRHKAAQNGWRIYAKPPGIVVDHRRQLTLRSRWHALFLRWPAKHSRNRLWRVVKATAVVAAVAILTFAAYSS